MNISENFTLPTPRKKLIEDAMAKKKVVVSCRIPAATKARLEQAATRLSEELGCQEPLATGTVQTHMIEFALSQPDALRDFIASREDARCKQPA